MLDTFRKRDNAHPTPAHPATGRPLGTSNLGAPAGSTAGAAGTARSDPASNKPSLLEPGALPPLGTGMQTAPAPAAAAPQPTASERTSEQPPSGARLIVGPEIKLKGAEITDCDTIIVEGEVDASMDSRVVEIAQQGIFRGKVEVDIAEIRGRFEGELTVHERLVIRETGRVAGKIRYGKVCIDEGGELSGDIAAADPAEGKRGAKSLEGRSVREAVAVK